MSRLRYVTSFPVDKTISCCQKTKTWIDLDEYFIELMSIINYYYLFICLLFIIYYLMGRFKCKVRVWVGCRNRLWSFCLFVFQPELPHFALIYVAFPGEYICRTEIVISMSTATLTAASTSNPSQHLNY